MHELEEEAKMKVFHDLKRSFPDEVGRAEMSLRVKGETIAETESIIADVACEEFRKNKDPEVAKKAFLERIKKFEKTG
jgi:hypothetical protein